MFSLRTRLARVKSFGGTPTETRFSVSLIESRDGVGRRHFQTTPCVHRIIRPRFPDFSPKITPDLKVQDTIIGEAEHSSLKGDPDAPSFEMEDPYLETPPKCVICENQIPLDYKNVQLLSQFISQFTGTIYPRKTVGLCTVQYEKVVKEIIYARKLAMMTHKFKNQSFYDDAPLLFPQPDMVIRKRLQDAAVEYKRQYRIEAGDDSVVEDKGNIEEKENIAVSNQ